MKTAAQRRDPVWVYYPIWFHQCGSKMRVERLDKQNRILVIRGSAAKVTIRKASSVYPKYPDAKEWFVDWEVQQCSPYEEGVRGRFRFNDEDIAAAFGLSESCGKYDDWLIERFRADVAEQGKYIRRRIFLNIPCPGTGDVGDPNVSVQLDEEIQNAVRQLLA